MLKRRTQDAVAIAGPGTYVKLPAQTSTESSLLLHHEDKHLPHIPQKPELRRMLTLRELGYSWLQIGSHLLEPVFS